MTHLRGQNRGKNRFRGYSQGDSLAHLWTRGEGCGDPSKEFFGTIIYHVRVDIEGHLHRAPFLSGILYQPPGNMV